MKKNFIELSLKDQLLTKIHSYITSIWASKVDQNKLKIWLSNFKNSNPDIEEKEQLNMLYLLSKFSYLGEKEVRILLKSLYRDLFRRPIIEKIRRANFDTLDLNEISKEFKKECICSKFIAVGSVSESGALLMYPFRQENSLSDSAIILQEAVFNIVRQGNIDEKEIKDESISRYIYIDDFIGSGSQGKRKLKEDIKILREKTKSPLEINYYVLVATEEGLDVIKGLHLNSQKLFDSVEAVFILDETFKTFGTNSRYFKNSDSRIDANFSKEVALSYGKSLFPEHELGFRDSQLLFAWVHNTPNNTLPIFWGENNWHHIFKRFDKITKQ